MDTAPTTTPAQAPSAPAEQAPATAPREVNDAEVGLALRRITASLVQGDADLEENRERVHSIVKTLAARTREADDPIVGVLEEAPPQVQEALRKAMNFVQSALEESDAPVEDMEQEMQGVMRDVFAVLLEAGAIESVRGIENTCQNAFIGYEVAKVSAQVASDTAAQLRDEFQQEVEETGDHSKDPADEVIEKIAELVAAGDEELSSHKESVLGILRSLTQKVRAQEGEASEDLGTQIADALHEVQPEAKELIEEIQSLVESTVADEGFAGRVDKIKAALQRLIKDILAGILDQVQGGTALLAKLLEKNDERIRGFIDAAASTAPLVREAAAAASEEMRTDDSGPTLLGHPDAAGGVSKKLIGAVLEGNIDLQRERARVEAAVGAIVEKVKLKVKEDPELQKLYEDAVAILEQVKARPETQQLLTKLSELANDEKTHEELQQKLEANKELLQTLLQKYASVVLQQIESASSDVAQTLEQKSGGRVRLRDGVDIANEALPLAKEKATALGEQLRQFGQTESLTQGVERLRQRDEVKALEDAAKNLDPQKIIEWGEKIARDAEARRTFVNDIATKVLEFLLSHLPELSLPPISGERDGLEYRIANLDLGGFIIHREYIQVRLNSFDKVKHGAPFFVISIRNIEAKVDDVEWSFQQNYFPHISGEGVADANLGQCSVEIGLQLVQTSGGEPQLLPSGCELKIEELELEVRDSHFAWLYNTFSELFAESMRLYIVSQLQDTVSKQLFTLSETLNSFVVANWSVVSNFLDIDVSQLPDAGVAQDYILRERMDRLRHEGKNVYSVTFSEKGQLGIAFAQKHEYVVVKEFRRGPDNAKLPAEQSGEIQVGDILVAFNGQQVTSLPLEKVMARLRRAQRPLHLTFMAPPPEFSGPLVRKATSDIVDVTFSETKLYLVIASKHGNEMDVSNPDEYTVQVKGFKPRDDGSKGPAEACGGVHPGMILAAVNHVSVVGHSFREVRKVLADTPDRPLLLRFARDPSYVLTLDVPPTDLRVTCVPDGPAVVTSFVSRKGPAEEQCGDTMEKGFLVKTINGESAPSGKFSETIDMLRRCPRPMTVDFVAPPASEGSEDSEDEESQAATTCTCTFPEGSPMGIIFYKNASGDAAFKAFSKLPGPVQATGKIGVGHVLLKINHESVPEDQEALDKALTDATTPVTLHCRDMSLLESLEQRESSLSAAVAPS
ncbi:Hypothetical Protein FCC1311_069902 [Hondaea fermentalgiana]|uniref:PDZ domain-containing protein n=1 Tax=Hondaea fermentalgiana TaxID=2315210 RepID=A0A2R5GIP9_9STRA|nr:Hypothetical Protein FCC1311_069902 [Hondaea fermentalgiana]|eukprot:GBG30770.1 Hypothetical Protein FCC1311_069902 [Hondaea fermentalgiana]